MEAHCGLVSNLPFWPGKSRPVVHTTRPFFYLWTGLAWGEAARPRPRRSRASGAGGPTAAFGGGARTGDVGHRGKKAAAPAVVCGGGGCSTAGGRRGTSPQGGMGTPSAEGRRGAACGKGEAEARPGLS